MPKQPPLRPPRGADLLRVTPAEFRAELDSLPAAALSWHPGPGEWCVPEVLGHMIVVEQSGFAGRIRTMLESNSRPNRTRYCSVSACFHGAVPGRGYQEP